MKEKDIQKLINRAIVARDKTYSPYSHFVWAQPFFAKMEPSMKGVI